MSVARLLLVVLACLAPALAHAGPIAVLYFENQGNPELEPLKVGLTHMLITDLHATGNLDVVERTRLQEVLDELELGHSGDVAPGTAAQVGRLLGARHLVMGTYVDVAGTFVLSGRIVEVETGKILHSTSLNGHAAQFPQLEKKLASELAAALGAGGNGSLGAAGPPPDASKATRAEPGRPKNRRSRSGTTPPPGADEAAVPMVVPPDAHTLDAAVAFSQGLIHLDDRDVPRAREAFERALAEDPGLDAARAELARIQL